jgi:hypothetical protein
VTPGDATYGGQAFSPPFSSHSKETKAPAAKPALARFLRGYPYLLVTQPFALECSLPDADEGAQRADVAAGGASPASLQS